jgi:hypothetical protein
VVGTPGIDVLIGTRHNDFFLGRRGDDRMIGLAGDDVLVGGPGNDGCARPGRSVIAAATSCAAGSGMTCASATPTTSSVAVR